MGLVLSIFGEHINGFGLFSRLFIVVLVWEYEGRSKVTFFGVFIQFIIEGCGATE